MSDKNWFREAKYGLFIHWGLYSILAGEYNGRRTHNIAEWIMNDLDIPVEEYEKLAERFNPAAFDADHYVAKAKEWGMQYITFTSKHHEGFAMYHSAASPYNVVDASPFGRDIVGELAAACKKHGIKLCLYYSQAQEWHHAGGYWANHDNSGRDFGRYLEEKCIPQLREILTNYGEIGYIWFDTPMQMTKEQSARLVALVKGLQPDCLVSGRIGNGLEDFMTTGDNFIPAFPIDKAWEVPATLNDTWGYSRFDENWKDPESIIRRMVKIAGRGGNYLLNVGPTADGVIPPESIKILDRVGEFLRKNGESIYGTGAVPPYVYDIDECYFTAKPHRMYIHLLRPAEHLELLNIANTPVRAYLLATGQEIEMLNRRTCEGDHSWKFIYPQGHVHDIDTVICVETEEEWPLFVSL